MKKSYLILSYFFSRTLVIAFLFLISHTVYGQPDPCETNGNDWEIFAQPDGNPLILDIPIFVHRDIIVRTGGHLVVNTDLFMGENNRIEVERGAKLEVIDGKISKACEAPWRSIFVHGNAGLAQPDATSFPGSNNNPLLPQEAGIVFLRNSTLEYSDAAIRTDATGGWFPERWGGLIDAENCHFSNNRVGVGFMRYEFPNNSKFIKCVFEETENQEFPVNGTHGVLIWRCDQILFQECTFRNLDAIGIQSRDAGYTVRTKNLFSNMGIGIEAIGSTPMAPRINIIGGDGNCFFPVELRNNFESNNTHILFRGTGEVFRNRVVNNNFSGGTFGVRASSLSNIGVSRNFFSATQFPVNFDNNFDASASVLCNEIKGGCVGVLARGFNFGIDQSGQIGPKIDGNEFRQFDGIGILLTEFNEFGFDWPGAIPDQGNATFRPAQNCFSPENLAEIVTIGDNTEEFTYFKPFVSTNNCFNVQYYSGITDNTNNFLIDTRFSIEGPCVLVEKSPPPTPTVLREARNSMAYWETLLIDDPNNEENKASYQFYFNEKENLLRELLEIKINDKLYDEAEELLIGESPERRIKWGYNIKLLAKDYQGAASTLNQLNTNDPENLNFVKTQEIVLESQTSTENFSLSAQQIEALTSIAEGLGKNSGYAMTLLELFSPNYEAPVFDCITSSCDCLADILEDENLSPNPIPSEDFLIYPNPANKFLNIEIDADSDKLKTAHIYSIDGKLISTFQLSQPSSMTINVEEFPSGTYLIHIEENKKTIFQDKFTIARY